MIETHNTLFVDISLGKTATTSRYIAARKLGFRSVHFPSPRQFPVLGEYWSDSPMPARIKELLAYFGENVRFMYVERDIESWIDSWKKHDEYVHRVRFADLDPHFRLNRVAVYGQLNFDEDVWRAKYYQQRNEVMSFIPEDQLMYYPYWMDLSDEWKWSTMFNFLHTTNKTLLKTPFPRKNVAGVNRN